MKRYVVFLLLPFCCAWLVIADRRMAMAQQRHTPDRVRTVKTVNGTCIGFETGDYLHALIRTRDGASLSLFVAKPGMEFFLAAHKGQPLTITYQVVETYIPEAGGAAVIERIAAAKTGKTTYDAWWKQTGKTASMEQLNRKYNSVIYGPSKPTPEPTPFYYGKWKVVDYKVMPVSALSGARARSWLGRAGSYGPASARFNGVECESTTYLIRKVSAADFVRDYRCKPADLGIPPGTIEILEVDSENHPFDAPGGVLIRRTDGRMLMFWAGVFFILQKQ